MELLAATYPPQSVPLALYVASLVISGLAILALSLYCWNHALNRIAAEKELRDIKADDAQKDVVIEKLKADVGPLQGQRDELAELLEEKSETVSKLEQQRDELYEQKRGLEARNGSLEKIIVELRLQKGVSTKAFNDIQDVLNRRKQQKQDPQAEKTDGYYRFWHRRGVKLRRLLDSDKLPQPFKQNTLIFALGRIPNQDDYGLEVKTRNALCELFELEGWAADAFTEGWESQ